MGEVSKSPIKSHAFDPDRLPFPKPNFDLRRWLVPEGGRKGFETIKMARREDRYRATKLKKSGHRNSTVLGDWLQKATQAKFLPLSCASAAYMMVVRRRLIGDLHRLISDKGYDDNEIVTFTLIHPKWFWRAGKLSKCEPKRIKAGLRRYLDRAGIAKVDGILFAGLHGEYDRNGYQIHFHGIAVGQKAIALDALRGAFGFCVTKTIYRPIQISNLQNAPRQLSYLLQSFWPMKKSFINAKGRKRKVRQKSRVPSPHHEEILLWLAKQDLNDLILMNGMRTGKAGLVSSANVHEFLGGKKNEYEN